MIRELNLKREGLILLCKSLGENTTLQGIDLSGNFKHGTLAGKVKNDRNINNCNNMEY